jgi:hypothetical protein
MSGIVSSRWRTRWVRRDKTMKNSVQVLQPSARPHVQPSLTSRPTLLFGGRKPLSRTNRSFPNRTLIGTSEVSQFW